MATERRQSHIADLLQSDQYYPIFDRICSYLSISDVYALHAVSRSFRSILNLLQRRWLNITTHLEGNQKSQSARDHAGSKTLFSFVRDATAFRYQLETCGGLITGGFAVNFFNLGHGRSTYMDIIVHKGRLAESLERYLQYQEKYDLATQDQSRHQVTLGRSTSPGPRIRITKTSTTPIHALLTSAYSTTDLCFITHNKAYCLFPTQTIVHHELHPLKHLDDECGRILAERAEQGWSTRDIRWPDWGAKNGKLCGSGVRRVGDRSSLIIPLEPSFSPRQAPDYVIEHCQFTVAENSTPAGSYYIGGTWTFARGKPFQMERTLTIDVRELKSPALRYNYTYGNCRSLWDDFVQVRLVRWVWVELYKMSPENRPPRNAFNGAPKIEDYITPSFKPPKSWDYADDQIPLWYKEWESLQRQKR